MVDGLLQFSRKQVKNRFERLDLRDVVSELNALIRESFDRKIEILTSCPDAAEIMGDKEGLLQAFFNLCTNALAAMPNGGTLTVRTFSLRQDAYEEQERVGIDVTDTGVGIPDDQLDKIFEPFYTTRSDSGGTGLGLGLCRMLISEMGGRIRVSSKPGRGSTFRILLAVAEA